MRSRSLATVLASAVGTAVLLGVLVPPVSVGAKPLDSTAVSTDSRYWTDVYTATGSRVEGRSLAELSDGSVVVTGQFVTQAEFLTGPNPNDSIVLTASGDSDIFVARLNPDTGYFTWAQRAGGTSGEGGLAAAVTTDDTTIVTGYFRGTSRFPTGPNAGDWIDMTASGDQDIFVAAVDSTTGYFTWVRGAGGSESASPPLNSRDSGYAVAVRADDTIIVTGEFEGIAEFPSSSSTEFIVTSAGMTDVFVAGVDLNTGYFTWAQRAGGTGLDAGRAVAFAPDGRPIIAGGFSATADFPTTPPANPISVTSTGGSDIFVAQMEVNGVHFSTVRSAGGILLDVAESVTVTGDGTPVITGRLLDSATFPSGPGPGESINVNGDGIDVFVAALDPTDWYFTWARLASGPDSSGGASVIGSSSGGLFVSGWFQESLALPTGPGAGDFIMLDSPRNTDAFVAGLDPATGYFTWGQQAGTTTAGVSTYAEAVLVRDGGTPIVVGYFGATAIFPSGPSTTIDRTVQPVGAAYNLFIGLLSPAVPPPPPPPPPVFPPTAASGVAVLPGDSSALISWTPPSSAGSFPITTYQAQVSPSGSSCLAQAPILECEVRELVNGVTYTASVRALNGAGWGPFSTASEPFTPQAPIVQSITITGTRGEVRGRPGVVVQGATTGMNGETVTSMVRLRGQSTYTAGTSRVVDDQGAFTWQRRTNTKVYVYFEGDSVRSTRVIIRTR